MGIPTVYIEALLYEYCNHLKQKGEFVPDVAIAGGLSLEDHVFKALALGAPFVKLVCMGRSIMTAAMVGTNEGRKLEEICLREERDCKEAYVEHFAEAAVVRRDFPPEPIRPDSRRGHRHVQLSQPHDPGLQQFMAGARKFALKHMTATTCVLDRRSRQGFRDSLYHGFRRCRSGEDPGLSAVVALPLNHKDPKNTKFHRERKNFSPGGRLPGLKFFNSSLYKKSPSCHSKEAPGDRRISLTEGSGK